MRIKCTEKKFPLPVTFSAEAFVKKIVYGKELAEKLKHIRGQNLARGPGSADRW